LEACFLHILLLIDHRAAEPSRPRIMGGRMTLLKMFWPAGGSLNELAQSGFFHGISRTMMLTKPGGLPVLFTS